MKYSACVVLYNPSLENISNLKSYPTFIKKLYIIDNSNVDNTNLLKSINFQYDVEYIPLLENKGIAFALKTATDKAILDGYDYLLTMDQDSRFPKGKEEELLKWLEDDKIYDEYGILGINYLPNSNSSEQIINCKYWLTSGNFLNLKNYKLTNGFNEDLFIDYVDLDIGHEFYMAGKKVGYLNGISLIHTIGNPIVKNLIFVKFTCMNHSPIRYYYRYRNNLYLYKRNKKFYFKKYWHDIIIDVLKLVLFEPNKKEKLKMIHKGRKDAKNGILGKYKGE